MQEAVCVCMCVCVCVTSKLSLQISYETSSVRLSTYITKKNKQKIQIINIISLPSLTNHSLIHLLKYLSNIYHMLWNCGAGEDSRESLRLQGDQTSQS